MNTFALVRAAIHDALGPAAALKAPEILSAMHSAGVSVVPSMLPAEYVEWVRGMVLAELFRGQPPGTNDPIDRLYQMLIWRLHRDSRVIGDADYRQRMQALDADVAARVAKLIPAGPNGRTPAPNKVGALPEED